MRVEKSVFLNLPFRNIPVVHRLRRTSVHHGGERTTKRAIISRNLDSDARRDVLPKFAGSGFGGDWFPTSNRRRASSSGMAGGFKGRRFGTRDSAGYSRKIVQYVRGHQFDWLIAADVHFIRWWLIVKIKADGDNFYYTILDFILGSRENGVYLNYRSIYVYNSA